MRLKKWVCSIALACLALLPVVAAEYRGQVTFDGLPLPGATVTATQGDKRLTAVSDRQGAFSFADLPDGAWSLEVEKPGFSAVKQEVAAGAGLPGPSVDLKMLPMDQMETVTAQAAPPPAPAEAAAAAPPDGGPAPAPAAANAAGTPATPTAAPAAAKGNGGAAAKPAAAPATAFQRTDLNASANAPDLSAEPAPEASSELTQRAADGFLINGSANNGAASPFGQLAAFGNARRFGLHLYTYAISLVDSNSALNAANYSLTGQHTPKPPFNNMTGTFSFGGPLRIPHVLERNGPTMNVSYSRIENRNSRVQTSLMPDEAERTGDFSQTLFGGKPVTIYDPASGNPFPGNVIPQLRISPQALSLMQYYPAPNFSSGTYNYQVPLIGNTHTDNLNLLLSKNFRLKNLLSGLLAVSDTRGDSNSQFNFLDLTRSLGINSYVAYRRMFTPRFYGTLTLQYSRNSSRLAPFFEDRLNVSGAAGIGGNNQSPLNWGPPSLSFNQSTTAGLSDGTENIVHNQTSAASYAGTWNHGRHNLTFGGDYRWQQYNTISQSNPRGTFTFSGAATSQVMNGVPVAGTGFDFADFLLGMPDASAIAFGNADKYLRSKQPDLYFQDDWRVAPGFTVNLGLRWEYTSPITEKYGRLVNLDVAPGFTAIAPVLATGAEALKGPLTGWSYPDSLIRPDYHEVRPSGAFAWKPSSASSLLLRGGYGISYNTQVYQPFVNLMEQQSPLSTSLNVANTPANPLTLANGFYAPPNVTTNTVAVNPNFKIGYAQAWNLTAQRDLPGSLQMVAGYVGTKGTHLLQAFAPNTYPAGAVNPCPSCPSGYTYYTSGGNSSRQAGILQLRRRMHNGILAQAQYTYSKSIDDAAALGGGSLGSVAQNWLNLAGERGPSSFDQRHLLNLTMQYTSGMGVRGGTLLSGWRGQLVKDWTFMDVITLGSGLPLTPIYASLIPGTGIQGRVRANYTGAPLYDAPAGYFLNPAAVAAPAPGQWGNAGIDSMRGPGQFSMNASMQRAFRLSERFALNLRLDANNALNHVVITGVGTTVTNPLFGFPANVNQMRTVTTTLRLTF
jgi:hypothetical protein